VYRWNAHTRANTIKMLPCQGDMVRILENNAIKINLI
jgi:hypothetical protein